MPPATAMNPYLKTKILTASREELRLLLFDGAIKFANQAKAALAEKQFEDSFNAIVRAQKIVLELSNSLDHKIDPELTEKLSALYTYIYKLLVDANTTREPQPLDEVISLLGYERDTWQMLISKLQDASPAADQPNAMEGAGGTPSPIARAYGRSA